jgi:putative ATP-binding cassette transporter
MASVEVPVSPNASSGFAAIELREVKHRYYHEQSGEFFELGPINLRFQPGEVVFLVGGNGSGKTTLAKLIVGLYPQESGELLLDGVAIDDASRDRYRQQFSAVFSDFHLFEKLLETGRGDVDDEGNRLVAKLHLQHKVQVRDGAFTTRELSQGQRKRLALIAAYLEDRPFLVFDEWAADQDPVFKQFFYNELLPELRLLGKTVLVISHDDRYFHVGDRIVRLESGKIVSVRAPKAPAEGQAESMSSLANAEALWTKILSQENVQSPP